MIYRSLAHSLELSLLDSGRIWIFNPHVEEDHLENGQILFWATAALPHDALQGIGTTRFQAVKSLNDSLNNKIGTQYADFIERNYFFPVPCSS